MPETQTTAKLAEALASFQATVGAIPRTREVKVETRNGGSYKFKYAPHEGIIEHIRQPLGAVGLAVSQHLSCLPDGAPALRTVLLHSSGERIEDVFPLPTRDGMTAQELGSAVTYCRRYALSAILGLATDDDDDGNHASGNKATFSGRPAPDHLPPREGSLIGVADIAKAPHDFELRLGPDGYSIGFKLVEGRQNIRVIAHGDLAEALSLVKSDVIGSRVVCFGHMSQETWDIGKGAEARKVPYTRLVLSKIETPTGTLPSDETAVAPSVPLLPDDENELDRAVAAI